MFTKILRLWTGPLPDAELFSTDHPQPFLNNWLFHPVKRHVAKYYLWLLQHFCGLHVIAVTGSAGKTVTRNLLFAILSPSGPTVATINNTTSTFNIPTTILHCTPKTKYLILEMSVEYPGDMAFYTWLARPDIGIIININRTHTLFLKDIPSVAAEKGLLLSKLPSRGYAITNADGPNIMVRTSARHLTFGASTSNYCTVISSRLTSNFTTEIKLIVNHQPPTSFQLPLIGEHFAANTAAAVTAASVLGIDPATTASRLESLPPIPRRLEPVRLSSGTILINDTHNANPLAATESITTLTKLAKLTKLTPVLVFGQMNELGDFETSAHQEIGTLIKSLGIRHLYCMGAATKHTLKTAGYGQYFDRQSDLIDTIKKLILHNSKFIILIKASRSFHFEHIVEALM